MSLPLKNKTNNAGFTLIELMLVLLLSSIILAGIYSAYKSQQDSYLAQDQVAEMQQNLRAAIQILTTNIRMAAFDPTQSGNPAITNATIGTFTFTRDLTGGEADGEDNDNDGLTDQASEGFPNPDTDEHLYGDGDTGDTNETITFGLTDDADNNGLSDTGQSDLALDYGGGGGFQAIAENIEAIEFYYTMEDGSQTIAPAVLADIRSVEVSILAHANQADTNFTHQSTYTTPSGVVWNPANDNFRRRFVSLTIQARNMGL